MGRVIVEDQMDIQFRRHRRLNRVEETAELDGPMPGVTLTNDGPGLHVQAPRRESMVP
jgi:hypothetical protein